MSALFVALTGCASLPPVDPDSVCMYTRTVGNTRILTVSEHCQIVRIEE